MPFSCYTVIHSIIFQSVWSTVVDWQETNLMALVLPRRYGPSCENKRSQKSYRDRPGPFRAEARLLPSLREVTLPKSKLITAWFFCDISGEHALDGTVSRTSLQQRQNVQAEEALWTRHPALWTVQESPGFAQVWPGPEESGSAPRGREHQWLDCRPRGGFL